MGSASTEDGASGLFIGRPVLRPRQQVEEGIRAAILSGRIASGDRLPSESELARQFGVGRSTVREALGTLAAQNLIYKVPGAGGGSFVRSMELSALGDALSDSVESLLALGKIDFSEVALVRQHLEVPATRLAALHRDEGDLEELRRIVAKQKSISVDDPEVAELDAAFHSRIAEASGNRVLAALVASLHRHTEPVSYLELSPEVGITTVRQHQRIVSAIEARDADASEVSIIEHLQYLRSKFKEADVVARA